MTIPYIEKPETEAEYQELSKLGKELKIPIPETFLQLEVFKDGQRIYGHKQRSHSWNRNAYNWMISQLGGKNAEAAPFGPGRINIIRYIAAGSDSVGTPQNVPIGWGPSAAGSGGSNNQNWNPIDTEAQRIAGIFALAGTTTRGIFPGSGNAAEDFNGSRLANLIPHGEGAGQLSYQTTIMPALEYDAPSKTLTSKYIRHFNNNSGGTLTLNEVGIFPQVCTGDTSSASGYCMVCRDVLSTPLELPDTGQLKVTFSIEIVYPE